MRNSSPSVSYGLRGRVLTAGVFIGIAAAYWLERGRNAGWGDSLGFLVAALEGFSWSVNATGHFLYSAMNAFLLRLFPAIDPVSLITAASMGFSLAALWQIYRTALLLTGSLTASLAGTLVMAFSFTFWRQAVSIEVYPLQMALLAAFLRETTRDFLAGGNRRHVDRIGITLGLALLVHIQTVLLFPAYAYWCVSRPGAPRTGALRATGWIIAAFLLLVIPAAILPELSMASVFVDFRFAGQVFALDPRILVTGFIKSVVYLVYNFHLFLPVMALGIIHLFRQRRRLFIFYTLIFVPVWGFAFRYPISDNYVFFLPAYLMLALAGASGFALLSDRYRLRKQLTPAILVTAAFLSPGVYRSAVYSAESFPSFREAFAPVRYKGGAAYYLWPGLRHTPDPLILVRRQYPG
ncbi:MAG: protein O-mannosyl-transferase family, partial [Candidatus Latescibacterota bacterium]